MPCRIAYVSFDGVTQPLGYSQVLRVLCRLAAQGIQYHLISVEPPEALADPTRVDEVRRELRGANIEWEPIASGRMRTASRAGSIAARVFYQAARIIRSNGIRLVHARGYQSAAVALAIKRALAVPFIFDARGCWIEERATPGEWFSSDMSFAFGKLMEQRLFREAAAVVTLTELQATDVREGLYGPANKPIAVIPTCADYDEFQISDRRPSRPSTGIPKDVATTLDGKLVVGIVGSLNRSYETATSMRLARKIMDARVDAHVLVLSSQTDAYRETADDAGIAASRITFATSAHTAMSAWVNWIDWSPLLLARTAAKRGSMPTKLAEFFASGVRPIHYGCNEEVAAWVRRAGSGIALDDLNESSLDLATRVVATAPTDLPTLRRAREITREHFSLSAGVERYEALIAGIAP